jgi:hypothetical protein
MEPPTNPDLYTTNVGVVKKLSDPPNTSATAIDAQLKSANVPTAACSTGK